MGQKKIILFLLSFHLLVGCTSITPNHRLKQKIKDYDSIYLEPQVPGQTVDSEVELSMPPEILSSDTEASILLGVPQRESVSLWVDAVAVDAVAALGFYEELEKKGLQVNKFLGSGFGCWMAHSLAAEGTTEYAEWQSAKWQDWEILESNLFHKYTRSAFENFSEKLKKILPPRETTEYSSEVECPFFSSAEDRLKSSQSLSRVEELYVQIAKQRPWLKDHRKKLPGFVSAIGVKPSKEASFFRLENLESRERSLNIYLSSEKAAFSSKPQLKLSNGAELRWGDFEQNDFLDIYLGVKKEITELKKLDNSRQWLLLGRELAQEALKNSEFRNFLNLKN